MNKQKIKRIELDVAPRAGIAAEFLGAWHGAAKAVTPATPRISFESVSQMHSVITDRRLELMRAVAQAPGTSIKALAEGLGRDYKNVHGDVTRLLELGLLDRADDGGLSAPYDEVVIHARISAAA